MEADDHILPHAGSPQPQLVALLYQGLTPQQLWDMAVCSVLALALKSETAPIEICGDLAGAVPLEEEWRDDLEERVRCVAEQPVPPIALPQRRLSAKATEDRARSQPAKGHVRDDRSPRKTQGWRW
jgi:hypothetical protein